MKKPQKDKSSEKAPEEPLDLELGLSPEDEAELHEEADRTYREWMRIIGEDSPD